MEAATRSVLKYPGAKWRIAPWVIEHMPPHDSYVEPFFGSGAVFFSKLPSRIETINDIDDDVTNLFAVIRDCPEELATAVALTPYSRSEYNQSFSFDTADRIEKARRFLVRSWMAFGGCGIARNSGWKRDIQGREAAYSVRNWNKVPEWIMAIVERLKDVQIENRPAVDVIRQFQGDRVLIYADPPYLHSTRNKDLYRCEMADSEHIELLQVLLAHKGPVVISGYASELYDTKDKQGKYRQFKGRNERDQKTRSKTFPGIARAMAEQWAGQTE